MSVEVSTRDSTEKNGLFYINKEGWIYVLAVTGIALLWCLFELVMIPVILDKGQIVVCIVRKVQKTFFGIFNEVSYTYTLNGAEEYGKKIFLALATPIKARQMQNIQILDFPRMILFVDYLKQEIFGFISFTLLPVSVFTLSVINYIRGRRKRL
ncbi:MAG: hypothetical protein KKB59_15795 [Spirochaetes bacterium]|nr:hypothetical protein [Spirochaetota bacterium]